MVPAQHAFRFCGATSALDSLPLVPSEYILAHRAVLCGHLRRAHVDACDFSEVAVSLCQRAVEDTLPDDVSRFSSFVSDASELEPTQYVPLVDNA